MPPEAPQVITPTPRTVRIAGVLIDIFWMVLFSIVVLYAFFALLGAYDPFDISALVGIVVLFALLLLARWWAVSHRREAARSRDPRILAARERRGF